MAFIQTSLATIGIATLLYFLFSIARTIRPFVIPSALPKYLHAKNGSWALVTGASDGIGRGFVEELLSRGFNVVIHGRNEQKLSKMRSDLVAQHPERKMELWVADASKPQTVDFDALLSNMRALPGKLTVLVNNVGGIQSKPVFLHLDQVKRTDIADCIAINATFPTMLTSTLLPLLKQNRPSLILNCGSGGGLLPMPYIVTYVSTKAYIHHFTAALKADLMAEGISDIEVLGLIIGNTTSQGNKDDVPGFTTTSRQCAKGSLDRVGCGETLAWVHWTSLAPLLLIMPWPESVVARIMAPELRKRNLAETEAAKKGN